MGKSLKRRGLDCYNSGDLEGAARWWREASAAAPSDTELTAYIEELEQVAPGLFAATAMASADPWIESAGDLAPAHACGDGGGLELVVTAKVQEESETPVEASLAQMRELLTLDNFSAAFEVARQVLATSPRHAEALEVEQRCRARLLAIYGAKVGDLTATPRVCVPPGEVIWLDLDHRSGFVLAQVDGTSSFEEILEVTGMDHVETLRILSDLLQRQIIEV